MAETAAVTESLIQLMQYASTALYHQSPFRILGIPVDAAPGQIKKRQQELAVLEKIGASPEDIIERFGGILPSGNRVEADLLRQAFQHLLEPDLRLVNEFFWFWPLNPDADEDDALLELRRGNYQEAVALWQQKYSQGNAVATHNLAVYYHVLALDMEGLAGHHEFNAQQLEQKDDYWRQAYHYWRACYDQAGIWQRMQARLQEIDDPRVDASWINGLREAAPAIILQISAGLAVKDAATGHKRDMAFHSRLMQSFDWHSPIIREALRLSVLPLYEKLKMLCSSACKEVEQAPEKAPEMFRGLAEQGTEWLGIVDLFLEKGESCREAFHDELAAQMQRLVVIFAQNTGNWQDSFELMEEAFNMAESPSIRQSIEEDINTIKNNKESDKCYFCGKNPKDEASAYIFPMYGEVARVAEWNGERIHWRTAEVKVPRCRGCKRIHFWINAYYFASLVLLLFLLYKGVRWVDNYTGFLFIPIVLAVLMGAAHIYKIDFLPRKLAKTQLIEVSLNYPLFRAMKEQGWRVGDSPPGVS